ncbi:hypothetical protein EV702DRAFT_1195449 [Suillus placidus]|uniref:DDE-1 domain-containing protein n=1 Tax=Suillus placidus TaxID=48579 RepID=A0A9P7D430_9AGAM|nr:hypothetical protein EV702DRAFT_1195449 [Suillus placidus]
MAQRKYHKVAAACARLAQQTQVYCTTVQEPDNGNDTSNNNGNGNGDDNNDNDNFDCGFTGGVHCLLPDPDSDSESDSGESVIELEGEELKSSLAELRDEVNSLAEPTPYQKVAGPKMSKNWKKAKRSRGLGYDGHSKRTRERRLHDARAREDFCEYAKTSTDPQISMMRAFMQKGAVQKPAQMKIAPAHNQHQAVCARNTQYAPSLLGFLSDFSSDEDDDRGSNTNVDHSNNQVHDGTSHISSALPWKHQKLEVPYHITKHLKSKKTVFVGGPHGLQARRTRTIEVHLMLVVKNKYGFKVASEMAAETNGFAAKWGGRQVLSQWGRHAKISSLLNDPAITSELRTFMRSNKWSMDPQKLAKFTNNELLHTEAAKYVEGLVQTEMPQGLIGCRVSLSTARCWLRNEGFWFMAYKKGLYFDGHDQPDVVEYRQNVFLPAMKEHEHHLVQYIVGDVEKESDIPPSNFVKTWLVICAHDEMTTQANDGQSMSWVPDGEHKLRKKGAGRGLHQSSIICSTVGHLEEAAHTIEYGKNYEGYWNGEMFVAQGNLRDKIIPAFKRAHRPGYQALFLIDNSQGHSAYAEDVLLISCMNINPRGKQAQMRDGWFIDAGGQKVIQPMMFPSDHHNHPNEPKGIKAVLQERGLLEGRC